MIEKEGHRLLAGLLQEDLNPGVPAFTDCAHSSCSCPSAASHSWWSCRSGEENQARESNWTRQSGSRGVEVIMLEFGWMASTFVQPGHFREEDARRLASQYNQPNLDSGRRATKLNVAECDCSETPWRSLNGSWISKFITSVTSPQAGFLNAIHATQLLFEKYRENQNPLHADYLNLEKALEYMTDANEHGKVTKFGTLCCTQDMAQNQWWFYHPTERHMCVFLIVRNPLYSVWT